MTALTWAADPSVLMIGAALLAVFSGLPAALGLLRPAAGQLLGALLICGATLAGLTGAVTCLHGTPAATCELALPLPWGPHRMGLDPLSALFSVPILLVACCSAIYGLGYRPARDHGRTDRRTALSFGLLIGALLLVLLARSSALFLLGWELMALSAYVLLVSDDQLEEVRNAGTLYLICTHIGTLALFALFSLLAVLSGGFVLPAAGSLSAASPAGHAVLLLALLGFGLKAGAMPLHVWLPAAHANAPSHISAVMSGVILKIGIYGLVRTLSLFSGIPLWWGNVVLVAGVVSAVAGVVFALGQHDLKRLLAYHSIENIGIIYIGIGTALIGSSTGSTLLVLLGMGGALLHVINHALFKALLFLGAGSVIHSTGTREIEYLGGLLRRMPRTAMLFLTGSVAICGLPPLNGFVSELLIYLGLFTGATAPSGATASSALAAPFLALVGGLAVACFVKVFGVVFLGNPRSEAARQAHEAGRSMLAPMALLALLCGLIGLVPALFAPLLDQAVAAWHPPVAAAGLYLVTAAPLPWLTLLGGVLLLGIVLCSAIYRRYRMEPRCETWGCGYLAPDSRMQYSASSFADTLVGIFSGILQPQRHLPRLARHFPRPAEFSSHVPETVLEKLYLPLLGWANEKMAVLRLMQHGQVHLYILNILITLIALLFLPL